MAKKKSGSNKDSRIKYRNENHKKINQEKKQIRHKKLQEYFKNRKIGIAERNKKILAYFLKIGENKTIREAIRYIKQEEKMNLPEFLEKIDNFNKIIS